MRVNKIEIKQEIIDIPNNRTHYDEVKLPGLRTLMLDDGQIPLDMVNCEKVTYELRRVEERDENGRNERLYLVKINDNKMFNDLLSVSNGDLNKIKIKMEIVGKIYYLRLFLGFLKSNKFKRYIFKNTIESLKESLRSLENDLYFYR